MKRINIFNTLVLLFSLISFTACTAQEADKEAEETAKTFLKNKYADLKDLDWGMDDAGNLEGQFEYKGEKLRADFTTSGEWIETESSIKWDDLPRAVQSAVKEEFDKDDITEIEKVDHNSKGIFFDVEFKQSGKNKDVEYNASGRKL